MHVYQTCWSETDGWKALSGNSVPDAQVAFIFGERALLQRAEIMADIRARHPSAVFMGCSTAGEIADSNVRDHTITVTAVAFERTQVRAASAPVTIDGSRECGRELATRLADPLLNHVFILSDGLQVNGSALVAGMLEALPPGVQVTGGLSADGANFKETGVLDGDELRPGRVAALGFYGPALRVGYGSMGGWDPFGPDRVITRAAGNVLYELDGKSALALYKQYLGDYAKDLPASGLLFPLLVHKSERDPGFVRTILSVDEAAQSMTFAGDMPQGALARLMKANFDRLIDGASGAASVTYEAMGRRPTELALLISCVGRKLVLQQRTEEEVEAVRDVLGAKTILAGFYSYGEISPLTPGARCDLHNQTMTITTLSEV
ncbi:MAG TPA: FIST N-terminal domain-containing protein [Kiritimatiellia bacterium]|nr:FIST N-terminal domain-containing protein [Kiritimatiellia bacterium]